MYDSFQVAFDAVDPGRLAEFWALALGYTEEPPPEGFASWEELAHSIGLEKERFGDQASLIDPAGKGPRLWFQRVPEGKTAKNRMHLDLRVAPRGTPREERQRLAEEKIAQLLAAGATFAWRNDDVRGGSTVLRDPEGNEFCIG